MSRYPAKSKWWRNASIGVVGCALSGVGAGAEPTATEREFIELQTSINAIMVALVDWSAHEVWEASYKETMTDRDWVILRQHATELLASGTLVSLGGNGRADSAWVREPKWQAWTSTMIEESKAVLRAIDTKDQDSLLAAGGRLAEVCEGCHDDFKPDVPTEGIMHVPHHDYGDPLTQD